MSRIGIIGAGPGGLSLARLLTERKQADVVVLERAGRVGGKSLTIVRDGLGHEMGPEPFRAAEAAGAHRHGLRRGIERAAGERQRDGKIGPAGKPAREAARLGRATQYEDAFLVHA